MSAMNYEYLIRRVNNCGRYGAPGANADIYRKLELSKANITSPYWNKTQEDKEYEYRSAFATVRAFTLTAIRKGISEVSHQLNAEEKQELDQIRAILVSHDFYDKEVLDSSIKTADLIFKRHGLEIR